MKRNDLYTIKQILLKCFERKGEWKTKLAFMIVKNLKMVQEEIKLIEQTHPIEPKEFNERKVATLKTLAHKDENGEPIWEIPNIRYKYTVSEQEINIIIGSIRKEYPEFNKKFEEYLSFLDEEIEIEFNKVDISLLPENIDLELLWNLDFMIK